MWLKNCACHALLKFEIQMGVAGSILKLQPCGFNKENVFLVDVQMLLVSFFDTPNQKSVNREKPILTFSFR